MDNTYFTLDDNFEKIISNVLNDKKIINFKQIPTGWTNIVYEVETTEGNFFFRFPRDEFWSRTIVKDYEFSNFIYGKTNFNTVKLDLFFDEQNRPFSMHKKIQGIPLADVMDTLAPEKIKSISNDIASFMYQLHCINYNDNNIFTINNIGLDLPHFLDELLNVHVSKKDMAFWNTNLLCDNNNCLVHGDLNSSNILLDENYNVAAIIDFGFGGYGNKYNDIGRIIGRCPTSFKNDIIESYENFSNTKLNFDELHTNIETWTNIDNSYINYMRTIGIYD